MRTSAIRDAVAKRSTPSKTGAAESSKKKKKVGPSQERAGIDASPPTISVLPTMSSPMGIVSALPAGLSPSCARQLPSSSGRAFPQAEASGPSAPSTEEEILLGMRVRKDASILRDPALARKLLMSLVSLPSDWEVSKSRSLEEIVTSTHACLFQMIHNIGVLDEGMSGFGLLSRSLRDEAHNAVVRAEVAEELLRAGEERERKLREDLARLSGETIPSLIAEREQARKAAADAESAVQAERERSAVRVADAEERASRAVEQASRAVAEYKASADFEAEVADGCVDAYRIGYGDCKEAVQACFPTLDLSSIRPPSSPAGVDAPSPAGDGASPEGGDPTSSDV